MNPYQSLTAQIMAAALLILQREQTHKETANRDKWLDTYDYIVVGSGSAGTPVAYRLTEDPKTTVLLLEAGGRQSVVTDIPENYITNLNSEYDWSYKNVRQPKVGLAFTNQQIPQNRGKVLGGSSTLNAIINNRGNRRDYDHWAQEYGAKGWSFNEVVKYFKRFENNTDPSIVAESPGFHGTSGPVEISSWEKPEPIIVFHQRALNQLGFKNVDINGAEQLGTCIMQTFQRKDGMRSSTANSYLDPNPHKNLHILTKAFATKILFNDYKGLNAEGIQFVRDGKTHKVKARKEVILSAGSINSPQLLMLSGIGPKDHLKEMGIPLKVDLPVGDFLKDHPSLSLNTLIADEKNVNSAPRLDVRQLHQFLKNASGPLTEFFHSITYFSTKYNDNPKWPDVAFETIVQRFPDNLNVPVVNEFEDKEKWNKYFEPFLDRYYMFFQPILMRVKSYGKLRLVSSDPFEYPLIDPKFLSDPQDYKALFEATKFVLNFLENSTFSQYVVPLTPVPGCSYCKVRAGILRKKYTINCDQYIDCLIRQITRTGYHPIGTTRMGAVARNDVVVDPRLRVKGVSRLRVCDSSIMPELINSNTNAASIMIGEKCADLIKEDNGFKTGNNPGSDAGFDGIGIDTNSGKGEDKDISPPEYKPSFGDNKGGYGGNKESYGENKPGYGDDNQGEIKPKETDVYEERVEEIVPKYKKEKNQGSSGRHSEQPPDNYRNSRRDRKSNRNTGY